MEAVPTPGDLSHYDTQVEPNETSVAAAENATLNAEQFSDWLSAAADEVGDDDSPFGQLTNDDLTRCYVLSHKCSEQARTDACLALRARYLKDQRDRVDRVLADNLIQRSADRLLETTRVLVDQADRLLKTTRVLVDQADRSLDMRPDFRCAISDADLAVQTMRGVA